MLNNFLRYFYSASHSEQSTSKDHELFITCLPDPARGEGGCRADDNDSSSPKMESREGTKLLLTFLLSFVLVSWQPLHAHTLSPTPQFSLPTENWLTSESVVTQQMPPDPVVPVAEELGKIEPLLPSLYLGMKLFPSLPTLIGLHGPQRYLIVVQNSDELRATGGFISALGVLTLDQGRIEGLDFVDSYRLYSEERQYPPAPLAMRQWMNIHYLLFRDANWSPDLPTTAMLLRTLYREETGVTVDGIVTVDLYALKQIVGALAPLDFPNAPAPLTEENVLTQVKALWSQPEAGESIVDVGLGQWWGQRKDFIPALAAAVMTKLESGGVDYVAVATAIEDALNERAIQIWLSDTEASINLAALGWDGGIHPAPGSDYLSLIDTNMGYNKANAAIERTVAYSVTWPNGDDAPAEATVTIDYVHPIAVENHVCDITPRYGADYQDLVNRCFFNYVRLYVPADSQLVSVTGLQEESIQRSRGEHGTQIFAGYFVLPPGGAQRVEVRYQLPATLTPSTYRLVVQRQAGSGPLPLTIDIAGTKQFLLLRTGFLAWGEPAVE